MDEPIQRPVRDALITGNAVLAPTVIVLLDGQQRARLRKACDNLIDAEDELLYVVTADPSLQPVIDVIVRAIVSLTGKAYPQQGEARR